MTRIGYVLRSYPVLYQATVFNEIRHLQRMGFEIDVFSLLEVAPAELRRDSISDLPKAIYCWQDRLGQADVLRANLALIRRVGLGRYFAAYQLAKDAGLLGNLKSFSRLAAWAQVIVERGVSHFHGHWATEATTVAMIFAWLTGLPFSFTAHAYDIFLSPQYLDRKLAEARFAVTVSEYNRQFMIQTYGAHLADKVHTIYPLLDVAQFPLRATAPQDGKLSIIAIGRLTEYKGFIHLVEACRILREQKVDVDCVFVGEGEDRADLEAAIARYGLGEQVRLLGSVPHNQVAALLEEATVFALPCVIAHNGDRDGMPMVLLEAMARGLPVVSSDVIGLPEMVRPEVGLLVPPADATALAAALKQIGSLGAEHQRDMGKAGREIILQQVEAALGAAQMAALFQGERPALPPAPSVHASAVHSSTHSSTPAIKR